MLEMLRFVFGCGRLNPDAKHLFSSPAVSSVCGWTETSITAGVTPVRHSGTPCSPKRRISSCRTSKSGLLSNRAAHRWGQKQVLPRANGRSPRPLEQWHRPIVTAHHQGPQARSQLPDACALLLQLKHSFFLCFCFFFGGKGDFVCILLQP